MEVLCGSCPKESATLTELTPAAHFECRVFRCAEQLARNTIGDVGAAALAAALRGSTVETVRLDGNRIGDEGVAALTAAVVERKPNLSINAEGNKAGDEAMGRLNDAVADSVGVDDSAEELEEIYSGEREL